MSFLAHLGVPLDALLAAPMFETDGVGDSGVRTLVGVGAVLAAMAIAIVISMVMDRARS